MNIEITAFKMAEPSVRTNCATVLANFDIVVAGIEICGCSLAIGDRHNQIMTWCPRVTGDKRMVRRRVAFRDQTLRYQITRDAYRAYKAFGGTVEGVVKGEPKPDEPKPARRRVWIGAPADYVPEVPADDVYEAGISLATEILGDADSRDPEALAYDAAVERCREAKEGDPDNSGLHRILRVEREEASRAVG